MSQSAIRSALELHSVPSRIRSARSEPLPDEIELLLRVAIGEPEAIATAEAETGRAPELLVTSAGFFIEQILLSPDANAYRMLGASADAEPANLRRNMALILRWMHPDLDPKSERSVFVPRVNTAWETLKSPERRAAYDRSLKTENGSLARNKSHRKKHSSSAPTRLQDRHRHSAANTTYDSERYSKPGLLGLIAFYLDRFRKP